MRTSNQNEIDQLVADSGYLNLPRRTQEQAIAEKGQRAFLHVVRAASQAVTVESLIRRALVYSDHLWRTENLDEEEYNAKMVSFCTDLMEGDELGGLFLASAAVWGGSKYV